MDSYTDVSTSAAARPHVLRYIVWKWMRFLYKSGLSGHERIPMGLMGKQSCAFLSYTCSPSHSASQYVVSLHRGRRAGTAVSGGHGLCTVAAVADHLCP